MIEPSKSITAGGKTYSPREIHALLQKLASLGINRDKIIAQINPEEAALLKRLGGSGKINPRTGLLSFDDGYGDGGYGDDGGYGGGEYDGGGSYDGYGGGWEGGIGGTYGDFDSGAFADAVAANNEAMSGAIGDAMSYSSDADAPAFGAEEAGFWGDLYSNLFGRNPDTPTTPPGFYKGENLTVQQPSGQSYWGGQGLANLGLAQPDLPPDLPPELMPQAPPTLEQIDEKIAAVTARVEDAIKASEEAEKETNALLSTFGGRGESRDWYGPTQQQLAAEEERQANAEKAYEEYQQQQNAFDKAHGTSGTSPGPSASPEQQGPAFPEQQGPAFPEQQGPAFPEQQGPAFPEQQGPVFPEQQGPAFLDTRNVTAQIEGQIATNPNQFGLQVPENPQSPSNLSPAPGWQSVGRGLGRGSAWGVPESIPSLYELLQTYQSPQYGTNFDAVTNNTYNPSIGLDPMGLFGFGSQPEQSAAPPPTIGGGVPPASPVVETPPPPAEIPLTPEEVSPVVAAPDLSGSDIYYDSGWVEPTGLVPQIIDEGGLTPTPVPAAASTPSPTPSSYGRSVLWPIDWYRYGELVPEFSFYTPKAARGGYFDADAYFADGGLVSQPRAPVQPTVATMPTMAYTDGQGLVGSVAAPPGLTPYDAYGSDAQHASPMAPAPAAAAPSFGGPLQALAARNTNAAPVPAPIPQNPNLGYSLGLSGLRG